MSEISAHRLPLIQPLAAAFLAERGTHFSRPLIEEARIFVKACSSDQDALSLVTGMVDDLLETENPQRVRNLLNLIGQWTAYETAGEGFNNRDRVSFERGLSKLWKHLLLADTVTPWSERHNEAGGVFGSHPSRIFQHTAREATQLLMSARPAAAPRF